MVYKWFINEIFTSIQGEGRHVGESVVFVRFAGCNLNCSWCDTDHSPKMELSPEEVWMEVGRLDPGGRKPVVITGGEPTLQIRDIGSFPSHRIYHLETNGSLRISCPLRYNTITISPKTKTMEKPFETTAAFSNVPFVDLKVVMDDGFSEIREGWECRFPWSAKYVQPCEQAGKTNIKEVVEFVEKNPDWKLSVQLHKKIGVK